MVQSEDDVKRVYVDSLRWRRQDLQAKIDAIARQLAAWTRNEGELKQQLRAVEQLLSAENEPAHSNAATGLTQSGTDPTASGNGRASDANESAPSFAQWSPKSRAIYAAAAEAMREAGVPLHYRVLAEEVQKRVALGGVDPGATLIAHLHRAQDVFPRVGRGIYGLQEMVAVTQSKASSATTPARRRLKTRRRAR